MKTQQYKEQELVNSKVKPFLLTRHKLKLFSNCRTQSTPKYTNVHPSTPKVHPSTPTYTQVHPQYIPVHLVIRNGVQFNKTKYSNLQQKNNIVIFLVKYGICGHIIFIANKSNCKDSTTVLPVSPEAIILNKRNRYNWH